MGQSGRVEGEGKGENGECQVGGTRWKEKGQGCGKKRSVEQEKKPMMDEGLRRSHVKLDSTVPFYSCNCALR